MRLKVALTSTTAAGLALMAMPAAAQTAPTAAQAAEPLSGPDRDPTKEILVIGIRGSVATASAKKKDAKQIVDSVVSEDAGKLPDNNVVEALSRVTGVQIDRARGQGQSLTIRGLDGVQTTINGNETSLGAGRALDLSVIPAELVKSIDVYKTRTADQVEGSIAGTVNVQLRRPLELKEGWTLAGSVRGAWDENSKKISPYASALIGKRFDTGIGEIGFLVNAALTKTFYQETYIESESPDAAPNLPNVVVPYRAQYGLEAGNVRSPSINAVVQWQANDDLDFVFEGGYIGSREQRSVDRIFTLNREGGVAYSNVELMPDGVTARKLTVSRATPNAALPVFIDGQYNSNYSDLYTTNFETHWRSDRAQVNVSAQYNWSKAGNYFVQQILQPTGLTSFTVDFASQQYNGGVPSITLNGANLSNPANYGVERFQDNSGGSSNKEFVSQVDVTLKLSENSLLRSLQTGARFSQRITSNYYGYRDGFPRVNGARAPLTGFPGGSEAALTGPKIDGVDTLQWYRIPGATVLDNIDAIRAYIQKTNPGNAARFASEKPAGDLGQTFASEENRWAMFAQLSYAFDMLFPVDGLLGVRYVNTWGTSSSFNYRPGDASNGFQDIIQPSPGRGNYEDILPSATATIHFTPKAQLRLSYTTNVQRPGFYDIRPFYYAETRANPPIIFSGNPDLKPQTEHAFDASAEYYFGRGGQLTLAAYYKKASNFLYYDRVQALDLTAYGLPGQAGFVEQQRNAGDGTFIGIEGTAQSFFDFLPGILRNFGASINGSYVAKARVEYPYPEDFPGAFDSLNTSKWTANAALFYDTPTFSSRVAFNYRSPYRGGIWYPNPEYSWYQDNTYRLDAAVNYTPVKFMTLSIEGGNLLGNDVYRYFGQNNLLPLGVRLQARTVQASARFRF
ncbi:MULTISPECIES: TonB-dependent receptor [unclassified Sphingomonas]|uniref:TonB-dependent receptor n=1 Tax=unclassified Sphingomonas TaxID=196159 RepID=UPI0006F513D4|nr:MULTISPECIES: TonB-dependent receptor [unclassified Sphingomonas]KQM66270.1 hypothetical protein ASE65_14620 [Sphingomonas sp. Leaf16]KQN08726.1 hypothetical protein ASE81_14665 [Sphingomonas sp. Leaf29]